MNEPRIGEVGYVFKKYFPNHGVFQGKVERIRPNAANGKDRRCVYTDGDVEDLSMEELIALQNINSTATSNRENSSCTEAVDIGNADGCHGAVVIDSGSEFSVTIIDLVSSATEENPIQGNDGSTEQALISLASLKCGSRFGIKVFDISDETRLVGEILADDRGWIKAMFGRKVVKLRASQFVVAPASSNVGDYVDKKLPLPAHDSGQLNEPKIGEVGYIFKKYFPNYGFFQGKVMRILPNAANGKDRRCVYDDGDIEDLSMEELIALQNINSAATNNRENSSCTEALDITNADDCHGLAVLDSGDDLSDISIDFFSSAPESEKALISLASLTCGSRIGIKVFNISDETRLVGETVEDNRGWIQAIFGSKIIKLRASQFIVAPTSYEVGDLVDKELPLPANDSCHLNKPKIGEVGYFFEKYFPNHGVFLGKVMKIRRNGARTCVYDDGDVEDLSMEELFALQPTNCRISNRSCEEGYQKSKRSASTWEFTVNEAEKSTLLLRTEAQAASVSLPVGGDVEYDSEEEITDLWLEKVAQKFLKAKGKGHCNPIPNKRQKRVVSSSHSETADTGHLDDFRGIAPIDAGGELSDMSFDLLSSASEANPIRGPDGSAEQVLVSLERIKFGSRLGIKVFSISDQTRLVGKTLEDNQGWIKAIFGRKILKLRASHFIVAPDVYKVGDFVDKKLALPAYDSSNSESYTNTSFKSKKNYHHSKHVSSDKKSTGKHRPSSRGLVTSSISEYTENEGNLCNGSMTLDDKLKVAPGVWLVGRVRKLHIEPQPPLILGPYCEQSSFCNDPSSIRRGVEPVTYWDPASIAPFIHWDPYEHIACEICGMNKDDHQTLICDECGLGYHMYCLRPVLVNVPTGEWKCPSCSPSGSFSERVKECSCNVSLVTDFLKLPFDEPSQFHEKFQNDIDIILLPKKQRPMGYQRRASRHQAGSLYFSNFIEKNDWLLPRPLASKLSYNASLISIVAGMKYCGMTTYIEDLIYDTDAGVTESMNDATLEQIGYISQRNLEIFKEFKHNLQAGLYPPIKLVYEQNDGLSVEAMVDIPKHTLISEYVGSVTTIDKSGETSSDCLMVLLDTGNTKTSLVIDPSRSGNIARFLNGVNNSSQHSLRKINVRTRRFVLDGRCRVAMFTSRNVKAGERLYYDYNAGMKGRALEDWVKYGFYDTSNFI